MTHLSTSLHDSDLSFTFKLCSTSNAADDGEPQTTPVSTPPLGSRESSKGSGTGSGKGSGKGSGMDSGSQACGFRIWDEVLVLRPRSLESYVLVQLWAHVSGTAKPLLAAEAHIDLPAIRDICEARQIPTSSP